MHYSSGIIRALFSASIAISAPAAVKAAEAPLIAPDDGPRIGDDGFDFNKKTRRSVSGLACTLIANDRRICLTAFDEGSEARHFILRGDDYEHDDEPVTLSDDDGEFDAEAVAADGRFYYVTGSHSVKRSDCAANPASRFVVRFAIDPETGRAKTGDGDFQSSQRLWQILNAHPLLKAHAGQCLDDGAGLNIEGLAAKDGRLYFGFRGPTEDGAALILSLDADALFSDGDPQTAVTAIAAGERRGIRAMAAVKDGFLALAGPDDVDAHQNVPWAVIFWNGTTQGGAAAGVTMMAELSLPGAGGGSCEKDVKPEALEVLGESGAQYRILVLSDGLCDGGPMTFSIPRSGK